MQNGPTRARLKSIAEKLNVSVDYLTGNLEPAPLLEDAPIYKPRKPEEQRLSQIESLKKERREVDFLPIVSWASAGAARSYEDMATFIDDEVRSTVKDPRCFALRLEGDSMEPRYLAGDLVIVNPHREPRNGSRVIAKLRDGEGVLFKVYSAAGNSITLTSYNPIYPAQTYKKSEFDYIYPVVELIRKEPL